jgi:hypothetical protein
MNAAEGLNVIEKLEISENWRALFMWFVFTEKCYLLCGIFTSSTHSTHVSAMVVVTIVYSIVLKLNRKTLALCFSFFLIYTVLHRTITVTAQSALLTNIFTIDTFVFLFFIPT